MIVAFDAVGTLIRTSRSVTSVYHDAGRKFGSQLSLDQVSQKFRTGRKEIFATAHRDSTSSQSFPSSDSIERALWRSLVHFVFDDIKRQNDLFDWLWNYFGDPLSWQLFDDTKACIAELNRLNLSVCVGSNFDSRIVPIFEHWLPELLGEQIHWSSKIGCRKPDRQFYRHIAELNPSENKFVMVGDDRINDYEAPIEFGWEAVLLDRKAIYGKSPTGIASLGQLINKLSIS